MKTFSFLQKVAKLLILVLFFIQQSNAQQQEQPKTPETITELKVAIEDVLKNTKTPAVGLALVDSDGPMWITGLGKANIENNAVANENTMFRIGSTSKMFVSLAILKLQEEGKLDLEDKVKDLVPEIEFINRWEDTHPVRIVHLLEHTTGWDDFHLTEYAHSEASPISLKDGLDFHPHSRVSRWIPGTRMAYCNSGPPVAAYIVEKITGQPFEDYIDKTFFQPMGMENMTYFNTDAYQELGATLYENGQPQDYWHILMRPSGSINASPKDMAKMVQFFVNRGMVDSLQLISPTSLKRMETTKTTSGAKAGLESGYGLTNAISAHNSFIYRYHDGGVLGGLTDFAYLPEFKVGYAIMINSGNREALVKVSKLVRDFQTNNFEEKQFTKNLKLSEEDILLSGYYTPINPRIQKLHFLERVFNIQQIRNVGDSLFVQGLLGGELEKYLPVGDMRYNSAKTGLIGMVQTSDPLAGKVIHVGSNVLKPVSAFMAIGRMILSAIWLLLMLSAVLFAVVWSIRYWSGNLKGGANIKMRLWPLLASLFILATFILIAIGFSDPIKNFGTHSLVSIAVMLLTIAFAITAVWSVVVVIKVHKKSVNKLAYWHSVLLSGLHLIIAIYFFYFGVIGIQTWA